MVDSDSSRLDAVFHALGDPTRRAMLAALAGGGRTVTELAEPHPISLAAASKHVRALEAAGLIRREVRWRTHHCRLDPAGLRAAHAWLEGYRRFWTGRLDALEELLRNDTPPESNEGETR